MFFFVLTINLVGLVLMLSGVTIGYCLRDILIIINMLKNSSAKNIYSETPLIIASSLVYIVTTITPFIDKDILCNALSNIGVKYSVNKNKIKTDRTDEVGNQYFEYINNKWVYKSNTAYTRMSMKNGELVVSKPKKEYGAPFGQPLAEDFLKEVEQEYYKLIQNPDTEISEKNKLYVEQRRQEIIAKAIAEGYNVEESIVNNKVQLVLARNSY